MNAFSVVSATYTHPSTVLLLLLFCLSAYFEAHIQMPCGRLLQSKHSFAVAKFISVLLTLSLSPCSLTLSGCSLCSWDLSYTQASSRYNCCGAYATLPFDICSAVCLATWVCYALPCCYTFTWFWLKTNRNTDTQTTLFSECMRQRRDRPSECVFGCGHALPQTIRKRKREKNQNLAAYRCGWCLRYVRANSGGGRNRFVLCRSSLVRLLTSNRMV